MPMVRETQDLPNTAFDERDHLRLVSDFEPAGDQGKAIAEPAT